MSPQKRKIISVGFSLVELLVAIAILGIIVRIIMVNINSARSKARDAQRNSDLEAIEVGLQLYHDKYGTYRVAGSGLSGTGTGWAGYENGSTYTLAVTHGLYNEKFLPVPIMDDPTTSVRPSYMISLCDSNQAYALYAKKENSKASDIAYAQKTCNGAAAVAAGENYSVANKTY